MNGKELEPINKTRTCDNDSIKNKETSITYENEGEVKTLRIYENNNEENRHKIFLLSMVMRVRKRLRAHLIRNKKHVVVMFICMDVVNTSAIRRMNARPHQPLYTSVRWKSLS